MNRKDQQLIYEAYTKVLEAAPQTLGSRIGQGLKGWAINKFGSGILSPFFASSKERLDADNQAYQEINSIKARLEAVYRQQYGKKYSDAVGADKQFVTDFIKNNMGVDLNDPEISRYLTTAVISDKNINEALKKAYAQKTKLQGGRNSAKFKFGQMLTHLKNGRGYVANFDTIIKQTMGDFNGRAKTSQHVDTSGGNPKSLQEIVKLLRSNDPAKIRQAIPYLQKFDDDMD